MRSLLFASLLAAATTVVPTTPTPATPQQPFETNVEIIPTAQTGYPLTWHNPQTFTCSAMVSRDFTDQRRTAFGVGKLVVPAGGRQTKTIPYEGYEMTFRVSISDTADRADATVTLRRDGEIVTRQRTTVWLDRSNGPRRVE